MLALGAMLTVLAELFSFYDHQPVSTALSYLSGYSSQAQIQEVSLHR